MKKILYSLFIASGIGTTLAFIGAIIYILYCTYLVWGTLASVLVGCVFMILIIILTRTLIIFEKKERENDKQI